MTWLGILSIIAIVIVPIVVVFILVWNRRGED